MRLIVVAVLVIVALAAGGLFYAKKKAEHDAHVAALKSQWDGFTAELRRDSDDYHAVANATGAYFAAVEDFSAKFNAVQDPAGLAIALDRLDTWADKKRANDALLMRFLDRDFRPRDVDKFSRDTAKYLNASSDLRDQLLGAHAAFATAEENPYAIEGSAYAIGSRLGKAARIYADEDESLLRRITSTSTGSLIAKVSNDIIRSKRAYLDAKSEPVSQWLFHT
jgi:hypothetical protein